VLVGRVKYPNPPNASFSSFVCGRAGPTCCVRSIEESPNPPHLPAPLVGANCRLPEGPPVGGLHVVRRRVYRSSRGRTRGRKPHVVRWSTDCPPVGSNPPLIVFDRPGGDPNGSDGRIYGSRRNLTLASEGAYRSSPTGLTPEIDVGSVAKHTGKSLPLSRNTPAEYAVAIGQPGLEGRCVR
jgi:hypothetical protein